jgi:DNA-binding transcriptional LysR family regulator
MYDITLQEIEYFLAAAERLNFTAAAQALFASQPVVSKSVKRLESELGLRLFNRENRGVSLTDEGRLLYDKWRFILGDFNASVKAAQSLACGTRRHVRIGCLSEFEHDLNFTEFIGYLESKYHNVSLSVELHGFKELREMLLSGAFDMIISYNGELEDMNELQYKNLTQVKQYIAISSRHPLAEKDNLIARGYENEIKLIPFTELFDDIYLAAAWKKDNVTPDLQKFIDLI